MRQVAIIFFLLLCGSPGLAWERGCPSGQCRIYQYEDLRVSGSSEPVRMFLEVTSSGDVIITALNTRAYHSRFFTTKPPTYAHLDGKDYVPVRTFFSDHGSPGHLVVDGNQVAVLPIRNESQLRARASDSARIVKSFISGTSATIEFASLLYGKQVVTLSLLGFTRSYDSLDTSGSSTHSVTAEPVDPVSVLTPLLAGNRFSVGPSDLASKKNPRGSGAFVYAPRTRYFGTERLFVWFVKGDVAVKLNGATHNLTPSLPFPRNVALGFWEGTGLSASTATAEGLKVAFGR